MLAKTKNNCQQNLRKKNKKKINCQQDLRKKMAQEMD